MSPSLANSRGRLQQAIDAQIKSLEESIRALRLRRNALAPISSLPPEVFAAIFSFLCSPVPALSRMSAHHQARLCVSHVCHQWREIALNQSLLWSNVNLTALSLDCATEILARAKSAPLYLEARLPGRLWNDIQFSAFQRELQAHLPDACHLFISGEIFYLHETLGRLVSPAPTLKCLSLFSRGGLQNTETGDHLFVPDTLFDGSAPRLSRLNLFNCEISWKSPLLKGLRHLDMRSLNLKQKFAAWLDALNDMSRLKTLVLQSDHPIAPQDDVEHNATLPSLTHLEISASPADCVLALAHLDLPALTALSVTVSRHRSNINQIHILLPHLARHAHGPQDTQPLQSMLVRNEDEGAKILAWPVPDIDVAVQDSPTLPPTIPSTRVALFFAIGDRFGAEIVGIIDVAMAALPLSGLVTLVTQGHIAPTENRFWQRHAPKWPLLRRAQLTGLAQQGFKNMLLEGNNQSPLLPLLTELVLVGFLSRGWQFALTKRIKQGVPLERLDLRMGAPRSPEEVRLLSDIVNDVSGPEYSSEIRERMVSRWKAVVCVPFTKEVTNLDVEHDSYVYESEDHEEEREDGDCEELED
jgi:hypothetical protein